MKGIILAGGSATRLRPLTKVTNKHLLPVGRYPMIYYPLHTLASCGIKDIMIVSGKGHAGHFLELLGSGKEFGVRLSYAIQEEAGGIAQALGLCEDFADNEKIAVILGDNIYQDNFRADAEKFINESQGAKVFLTKVDDPQRFGVPEIEGDRIINIEEKPQFPKSPYAVTGFYLYDSRVWKIIKTLKPSGRGELEITDVNNFYVQNGTMKFSIVNGWWLDAGTFPSLHRANMIVARDNI
ncbi:sugar phosphate nucleotidyltransferase, partial [Patescibacteria group bacterium]